MVLRIFSCSSVSQESFLKDMPSWWLSKEGLPDVFESLLWLLPFCCSSNSCSTVFSSLTLASLLFCCSSNLSDVLESLLWVLLFCCSSNLCSTVLFCFGQAKCVFIRVEWQLCFILYCCYMYLSNCCFQ